MYSANFCGGWNFKIGHPNLASGEGFMWHHNGKSNFRTDHVVKQEMESKEGTSRETFFKDLSLVTQSSWWVPPPYRCHRVPAYEPSGNLHHIHPQKLENPRKGLDISVELVALGNK